MSPDPTPDPLDTRRGTPAGLRLCALADLPVGEALRVDAAAAGTPDAIAVFHDEAGVFALDDTCTHALASLAEGWVEGGAVECPLHSARFDLATGAALSLPAVRAARTHRVEVVDGAVVLHPGEAAS